jgi:hypothetical protein
MTEEMGVKAKVVKTSMRQIVAQWIIGTFQASREKTE